MFWKRKTSKTLLNMKKTILLLFLLVAFIQGIFAQIIMDEDGNPQPFSLNSPYREMIKPENMTPNYITKAYNNDSLLVAYNPPGSPDDELVSGIVIDSTRYDFKQVANHFDLGHGDLWIYKLTSPTAKGLTIRFDHLNIPEGALLSDYQLNGSSPFNETPRVFNSTNESFFLSAGGYGNEVFVEYYEPKGIKNPLAITFKYIAYDFTNGLGVRLEDFYKKKVDAEPTNMKSGFWGFSNYSCNNTLPCPSVAPWSASSKSVAYLFIQITISGVRKTINGTGFFINRGNNYVANDYPYLITCGHAFKNGTNKVLYDHLRVYVNYEDQLCGELDVRQGSFVGSYNILQIGTTIDASLPGYSESEDYALLQSEKKVSELAKSNISYAGWSSSFTYGSSKNGYTYIGHPGGNIKTVNTETGAATAIGFANFSINNKVGVNEPGFSGSPVFYSGDKAVVGWVCTTNSGNYICGDGNQPTRCGLFSELYLDLRTSIDPTNVGSASSSNPTATALPTHCKNCIKDGDETEIDCGGSCQPCGMADNLSVTSNAAIAGKSNINARFNLTVNGSSSQVNFKSQNYTLKSGGSVTLKNTKVSNGTVFKATVNEAQKYAENQGCQPACVLIGNVFTPNGDGMNDFLLARFAFVKEYEILIRDRYGVNVYKPTNSFPVYENGVMSIWDGAFTGTGGGFACDNCVYFVSLKVKDCNGNIKIFDETITSSKSAFIDLEDTNVISNENPFNVYPNPATQELKVSLSNDYFEDFYSISIYDLSGKRIKDFDVTGSLNTISISDIIPGVYTISVNTNKESFNRKFIKQ
jgi:hypothetical protein